MKLLQDILTLQEDNSGNFGFQDAEYTAFIKPEMITDIGRWNYDLSQYKLKVTVNNGVHELVGQGIEIFAVMVNQGMSDAEAQKLLLGDNPVHNLKKARNGEDFETDDEDYSSGSRIKGRFATSKARAGRGITKNNMLSSITEEVSDAYFVKFEVQETSDNFGDMLRQSSIEKVIAKYSLQYDYDKGTYVVHGTAQELKKLFRDLGVTKDKEVYSENPHENFLKDRGGEGFDETERRSGSNSSFGDRSRARRERLNTKMRGGFSISGIGEATETLEESASSVFNVRSFDMTRFNINDIKAILNQSGYDAENDIFAVDFDRAGTTKGVFVYVIRFTEHGNIYGEEQIGKIFISIDSQTGKLVAEF